MGRMSGSGRVECLTLYHPKTFPVRFRHKFGKLSAGGKRRNSTQIYRDCAAVSRQIPARVCVKRFVPGCSMVWTLQRAQWRMVGQPAIQLRLVRPFFRALPFLASMAGPATGGTPKFPATDAKRRPGFPIRNPKSSSGCDRDWFAGVAAAGSPF